MADPRHFASQQLASLFDHLVGAGEPPKTTTGDPFGDYILSARAAVAGYPILIQVNADHAAQAAYC